MIHRILLKFMDAKHVDSFLNEGLLYMNTIDYFRNIESEDEAVRGDPHEGLQASLRAEETIIEINGIKLDGVVGKIDVRYNHQDETNIYSMAIIGDHDIIKEGGVLRLSEKFEKFGNKAVLISGNDISTFLEMVKSAISRDQALQSACTGDRFSQPVSYVERDGHHPGLGIFSKFSDYAWQYEWRIALKQRNPGPYSLKIGNLSNIATVLNTEDIVKSEIRLEPNKLR